MTKTSILDSRDEISKLDLENMMGSIEKLGNQIEHSWNEIKNIEFEKTTEIHNVIVAGMGGSGLGADVIKNLFKQELKVPFDYVHDYTLPGFVNQHTLVILASYSGNTEEIISCAQLAQSANAQIMVIASGGKLEEIAIKNKYTFYKINPTYNPSQQPRMAIGYTVFGTIGLLAKAGIISLKDEQIKAVVDTINRKVDDCKIEVLVEENPAKALLS